MDGKQNVFNVTLSILLGMNQEDKETALNLTFRSSNSCE